MSSHFWSPTFVVFSEEFRKSAFFIIVDRVVVEPACIRRNDDVVSASYGRINVIRATILGNIFLIQVDQLLSFRRRELRIPFFA